MSGDLVNHTRFGLPLRTYGTEKHIVESTRDANLPLASQAAQ